MNEKFDLGREALAAFSAGSHERAYAPTPAGRFRCQMMSVTAEPNGPIINSDDDLCEHNDSAKMASLQPVFGAGGRTTATTSSQFGDAAAALLIADREYAERNGRTP